MVADSEFEPCRVVYKWARMPEIVFNLKILMSYENNVFDSEGRL